MDYCDKCKSFSVQKHQDKFALSMWKNTTNGPELQLGNFLPVESYICGKCYEVTFKLDKRSLS